MRHPCYRCWTLDRPAIRVNPSETYPNHILRRPFYYSSAVNTTHSRMFVSDGSRPKELLWRRSYSPSSGEIYISGINDSYELPPTPEAAIPLATEIAKLKEIADTLLPVYRIKKEQLCFRPMTESGNPFIGLYPQVTGVYIGAGHSHFGIILGPGTGKVLSEMIMGEELTTDVSQFSLPD